MKQNLSAEGTIEAWIEASEAALWNAKFVNIDYNPETNHLQGDIGMKGSIDIDFSIQNDGRVRLEIVTSDQNVLNLFKKEVTKVFLHNQQAEARQAAEAARQAVQEAYTPSKEDYNNAVSADDYDDEADVYEDTSAPYDTPEIDAVPQNQRWAFKDENGRFQIPPALRYSQVYHKVWFIVLMLIILPPVGIFLMYYYRRFRILPRIVLTIVAILYAVLVWVGIFGVNTGLNQENIQTWYNQQRSQFMRAFNLNTSETPRPDESTTTDSSTVSDNASSNNDTTSNSETSDDTTNNNNQNFIQQGLESFSEGIQGLVDSFTN